MPACCRTRSISRNSSVCRPTLIPALVSLRLVLDGQLDSLAVATDGKHRILAPFPVTLKDGKAEIQGKPGLRYQVLLDGERVIDVESQGLDQRGDRPLTWYFRLICIQSYDNRVPRFDVGDDHH